MSSPPAIPADSAPAIPTEPTSMSSETRMENFIKMNVTLLGAKTSDAFPIVDKLWDIFAGKGIRTVLLSIGTSQTPLPDLELAESLGCPLHIVPLSANENAKWSDVSTILKERKREPSASPFTEGVDGKWILPKNLRIAASLPWWGNGQLDLSGCSLSTQNIGEYVNGICAAMKLKDGQKRIDIVKIDTTTVAPGLEIPLLGAILHAGFRPSVLLVKWSVMPDIDISTTISAGNLQCAGYSLLDKVDGKFLYYFNDESLYEICSWEKSTVMNPIAEEILKASARRY